MGAEQVLPEGWGAKISKYFLSISKAYFTKRKLVLVFELVKNLISSGDFTVESCREDLALGALPVSFLASRSTSMVAAAMPASRPRACLLFVPPLGATGARSY